MVGESLNKQVRSPFLHNLNFSFLLFYSTAPAAQTETVLVCVKCHQLLTQSSDKDKDKVS